ncbi:MAG: hypothetical protein CVT90_01875 [Candidatus Altiarchaeales archaeon HGW-Altiarchaeales-3]|nr:MAG: hypothetical protein CVT90_01875 [Candidatus Altiarchaeales archaeon HGW-Altiarchaeales-3]
MLIRTTIGNIKYSRDILPIFEDYNNDFEYTADGIFRQRVPPLCTDCHTQMTRNGWNPHTKKGLGSVKIGKYICPICKKPYEDDPGFWEKLKQEVLDTTGMIYQKLRSFHAPYQGISELMDMILPQELPHSRDTVFRIFAETMKEVNIPLLEYIQFVHYDEQHPKVNGVQKFRLTLIDYGSGRPIADELCKSKDSETVKAFLRKYLDPCKPIFIVTDMDTKYPGVFKEVFGENLLHQFCLYHLNGNIVKNFPRNTTFEQEFVKYRLLNIFYNRDAELDMLRTIMDEEKEMKQEWFRFNWNDIIENDEVLCDFLDNTLGLKWAKTAKIERSKDNKTVWIVSGENSIRIRLNKAKTKVSITSKNRRVYEYLVKDDDNKLNIYDKEYAHWIKNSMKKFRKFVHNLKLIRRRNKENLEQRSYNDAVNTFSCLIAGIDSYDKVVQNRLNMIEKNWDKFTRFYRVKGAPATNNAVENYYSASLKTHQKKKFRTDAGIENQMKISEMRVCGRLNKCKTGLFDVLRKFWILCDPG